MPYTPPLLIKPPLSPLRPPVSPPYRPPGPNRLPPTQPAPIYQPPDLLPPTNLDLKGKVCVYSNVPLWEPKKIRYRYPGENWKEIAGESYTLEEGTPSPTLPILDNGIYKISKPQIRYQRRSYPPGFKPVLTFFHDTHTRTVTGPITLAEVTPLQWRPGSGISPIRLGFYRNNTLITQFDAWKVDDASVNTVHTLIDFSYTIERINPPPENECTFKVFNIFNQEILSITREDCPEVIVVPERCYFKDENERLVARVIQTLLDPPLRVEYQGHCATVWKDGIIALPPYPLQIYKECSDNPNCPPPRIRFDQKCEEKCEQCPPGTAIKVLLGSRIACVNSFGCIKKMIQYKPGCNRYDCICR